MKLRLTVLCLIAFADPAQVATWRLRLDALGPRPKVAFSWRSRITSAERRRLLEAISRYEAFIRQKVTVNWVVAEPRPKAR